MSFPDIRRVFSWYLASSDGLKQLASLFDQPLSHYVSDATYHRLIGMTKEDFFNDFLREKLDDHELAASLALLANCEGAIKRDMVDRVANQGLHHQHFAGLVTQPHVSITWVLDKWMHAVTSASCAYLWIDYLKLLYRDRNVLAHGSAAHGQFAFKLIREELDYIQDEWKRGVADFAGF